MDYEKKFVLWFRANATPKPKWAAVFAAPASQSCTDMIGVINRNGDWITLREGRNPNDERRAR